MKKKPLRLHDLAYLPRCNAQSYPQVLWMISFVMTIGALVRGSSPSPLLVGLFIYAFGAVLLVMTAGIDDKSLPAREKTVIAAGVFWPLTAFATCEGGTGYAKVRAQFPA